MTTHIKSLDEWLLQLGDEQKTVRLPKSLGLERVSTAATAMGLLPFSIPAIIVAGTNGKGSTIALMEAMLIAHGYRVGSFTSPHLIHANERIKINTTPVSDDTLIQAFETIDSYQFEETPSYFEFFTLAALLIFKAEKLDYVLLEVGLGGRLDAVNIIASYVSVITSISLDHQHILGKTREEIALEKAGIFRENGIAVCGCINPPTTLIEKANALALNIDYQTKDFKAIEHDRTWDYVSDELAFYDLPKPRLLLQNAATAIKAISLLPFTLKESAIKRGLSELSLAGRQQWLTGSFNVLLDVAHNVDSMKVLAETLAKLPNKVIAVFSMLKDKALDECISLIAPYVKTWCVAPLNENRALSLEALKAGFERQQIESVIYLDSMRQAFDQSKEMAGPEEIILVTGSFLTVGMAYKSGYTGLTMREKVV